MTRFSMEGRTATGRDLFKEKKKNQDTKRSSDTPSVVQLGEHGRYQIKSGRLSGEYVARAFPKPPTNARGLIAEAMGATEEAAIDALHQLIDAREIQRNGIRRIDEETGMRIPSSEEFQEALNHVALSRPQRAMLAALALSGDGGLTETRMASAAGYKSKVSANRAFAAAGLLIATYLAVDATSEMPEDESNGASLLGFRGIRRTDDVPGSRILHPELREALTVAEV